MHLSSRASTLQVRPCKFPSVMLHIMRVFATSRDTGVNAEITYTIVGGNEQGKFSLDPVSGVLTITEELDFEAVKEYMLTVQGNDGGTPSLSNTAIVKINLTDANDNTPVFAQTVYTAEVAENARQGSNVMQVCVYTTYSTKYTTYFTK